MVMNEDTPVNAGGPCGNRRFVPRRKMQVKMLDLMKRKLHFNGNTPQTNPQPVCEAHIQTTAGEVLCIHDT